MASNPFTRHPTDIGESYGEHCAHALAGGTRLVGAGLAAIIHAFLPFLFVNTASNVIKDMNRTMTRRVDRPNWERHPII